MLLNVFSDLKIVGNNLVGVIADDPLPEAVTAIGSATVGDQEQPGLSVLVLETGHDGAVVLSACIKVAGTVELFERRLNDVLELLVVAALPNLTIVNLRYLVSSYVVIA